MNPTVSEHEQARYGADWGDDRVTTDGAFAGHVGGSGLCGGVGALEYQPRDRESAYGFVQRTLVSFGYHRLGRADRGLLRRYIGKVCGFSASQITRLIRQQVRTGVVEDRRGRNSGRQFQRRYGFEDIRLLAEVDEAFGQMSGLATCEILRREYRVHGDSRFVRLASLSRSHLYNLRRSRTYQTKRRVWSKTRGNGAAIAVRKAPEPNSRPGYIRVDTVHQGDQDGRKGVYLINLVDQVTQYEYVGAVAGISERFLVPTLEALLWLFPFVIRGFHADNGQGLAGVVSLGHPLLPGTGQACGPHGSEAPGRNPYCGGPANNQRLGRRGQLQHPVGEVPCPRLPQPSTLPGRHLLPFLDIYPNGVARRTLRPWLPCTSYTYHTRFATSTRTDSACASSRRRCSPLTSPNRVGFGFPPCSTETSAHGRGAAGR